MNIEPFNPEASMEIKPAEMELVPSDVEFDEFFYEGDLMNIDPVIPEASIEIKHDFVFDKCDGNDLHVDENNSIMEVENNNKIFCFPELLHDQLCLEHEIAKLFGEDVKPGDILHLMSGNDIVEVDRDVKLTQKVEKPSVEKKKWLNSLVKLRSLWIFLIF